MSAPFRGVTAGRGVDNFVAQSAGVPMGVYGNNNAQNVVPFYGDSRAAPPPVGTVQQAPGVPGYVGVAPSLTQQPLSNDLRLMNPNDLIAQQPRPGELILPGPVDPTTQSPTVITATPLYGIRQWRFGDTNDQQFLNSFTDLYATRRQANLLDNATLNRMRTELQQNEPFDTNNAQQAQPQDNAGGAWGNGQRAPGDQRLDNRATPNNGNGADVNQGARLDQPFDAVNPNVNNQQLNSASSNGALSSSGANTGQSVRNQLPVNRRPGIMLAKNSPQYRELERRLSRYRSDETANADVRANAQFQEDRRIDELAKQRAQGNQPGQPGQPNQPGQPGGVEQPGGVANNPGAPGLPGAPGGNQPGGANQPGGVVFMSRDPQLRSGGCAP